MVVSVVAALRPEEGPAPWWLLGCLGKSARAEAARDKFLGSSERLLSDICLIVIIFLCQLANYFLNSCELFSSTITCGNELQRVHCVKNLFWNFTFIFMVQIVSDHDFLLWFMFFLPGYLCT